MIPEIRIKTCRHGRFMYYANDAYIGRSLDHYGEYSEDEVMLWQQFVKPGMTAMDVGANIGPLTISLAKMVGPTGRVLAIEPQKQIFQMLIGNLALNELTNTVCMNGAAGDKIANLRVPKVDYSLVANFGGVPMLVNPDSDSDLMVPLFTIDSLKLSQIHFIKIDVEGMEQEVVEGAAETLTKLKPVLYVENDKWRKSHGLIECLLKLDYRMFWHLPLLHNPNNYNHAVDDLFPNIRSCNMLCVHPSIGLNVTGFTEIKSPDDLKAETAGNEAAPGHPCRSGPT